MRNNPSQVAGFWAAVLYPGRRPSAFSSVGPRAGSGAADLTYSRAVVLVLSAQSGRARGVARPTSPTHGPSSLCFQTSRAARGEGRGRPHLLTGRRPCAFRSVGPRAGSGAADLTYSRAVVLVFSDQSGRARGVARPTSPTHGPSSLCFQISRAARGEWRGRPHLLTGRRPCVFRSVGPRAGSGAADLTYSRA